MEQIVVMAMERWPTLLVAVAALARLIVLLRDNWQAIMAAVKMIEALNAANVKSGIRAKAPELPSGTNAFLEMAAATADPKKKSAGWIEYLAMLAVGTIGRKFVKNTIGGSGDEKV